MEPYYQDEWVTLWHGDCLETPEWMYADVLVTDPPYGANYASRKPGLAVIANDFDTDARDTVLALWGSRPALVFGTWQIPHPKGTRQTLVWWKREQKNLARHSGRPWASNWEEIYVLGEFRKDPEQQAAHSVYPTDEHRAASYGAVATHGHPTPKPVVLMEQLLAHTHGVIADPFAGVGATLLAAQLLHRRAVGVELEERYCEVAANRLAQDHLFSAWGSVGQLTAP